MYAGEHRRIKVTAELLRIILQVEQAHSDAATCADCGGIVATCPVLMGTRPTLWHLWQL